MINLKNQLLQKNIKQINNDKMLIDSENEKQVILNLLELLKNQIKKFIMNYKKYFKIFLKNEESKFNFPKSNKEFNKKFDKIFNDIILKNNNWKALLKKFKNNYKTQLNKKQQNCDKYSNKFYEKILKILSNIQIVLENNDNVNNENYNFNNSGSSNGNNNSGNNSGYKKKGKVKKNRFEDQINKLIYRFKINFNHFDQELINKNRQSSKNWRNILKILSNERGPFGNEMVDKQRVKLKNIEDFQRKRRIFKINSKFSIHKNASLFQKENKIFRRNTISQLNTKEILNIKLNFNKGKNKDKDGEDDDDDDDDDGDGDGDDGDDDDDDDDYDEKKIDDDNNLIKKNKNILNNKNKQNIQNKNVDSGYLRIEKKNNLIKKKKKILFKTECQMINSNQNINGLLTLTNISIEFNYDPKNSNLSNHKQVKEFLYKYNYKWNLIQINKVLKRRFHSINSAIEIFLKNNRNYFLNIKSKNNRINFFKIIKKLKSKNNWKVLISNPKMVLKKSNYTKLWIKRKISNFEYLMKLNTLAGRTYNDLNQYPVFPWVLSNYNSETLDLKDQNNYRDLSKPIGALNKERLKILNKNFKNLKNNKKSTVPPYLYYNHYSTNKIVLYYLIRLEPFTTISINNFNGKFDQPEKIFHSVSETWNNCLNDQNDFKELIPEFYYLPEFLENSNNFDLGEKPPSKEQETVEKINNVILPPWANGSPYEFIRTMREALESEYVSEHLNEWIDLIFGYKQTGEEAIKAWNLFYSLSYEENASNVNQIENRLQKRAIEDQIQYFGQTPIQLFTKPHPKRGLVKESDSMTRFAAKKYKLQSNTFKNLKLFSKNISNCPIICLGFSEPSIYLNLIGMSDKIITMDKNRKLCKHRWLSHQNITSKQNSVNNNESNLNVANNNNSTKNKSRVIKSLFTFEIDPHIKKKERIGPSFSQNIKYYSNCFVLTKNSRILFVSGFLRNCFNVIQIENSNVIQSIHKHKDIVTCLALDETDEYLISGSKDTTATIWKIEKNNQVNKQFLHVLYGHDDEITCVDVSKHLDLVVTGSKDKTLILHSLSSGKYLLTIVTESPISMVKILNKTANILVYSREQNILKSYSLNGKCLRSVKIQYQIFCWLLTKNEKILILAGSRGNIRVKFSHNFKNIYRYNLNENIYSMVLSKEEMFILFGLENGNVLIGSFLEHN
ncbi:beige/beach-related [Anaeramoeba flamelloides]|uniref:Beige/beach-related n=1 Tax=Anaeramoeba flamelloides TaxID=1746091 RepID=A0AAV7ZT51_9EUKA|nr:beige/beach-related [Anaeramoeba flamelloides]